jgi:hypothetical protein
MLLTIGQIIETFPQVAASWILAFFLPSLLFRFSDTAANRLRQIMMLLFLSLMVGMLLFGVNMPLFVTTVPTMLAFSVAYLIYLVRQAQMSRSSMSVLTALLGVAIIFPLLTKMFLSPKPDDLSHEAAAAVGLKEMTKKGDAVLTDNPQVVAWYANRPAIYIPLNDAKIANVRRRFQKARYLFLTENIQRDASYSEEWRPLYIQLARWNELYARQREIGQQLPAPPGIVQTAASGNPFWMSLEGFITQPPVKGGRRVAILASSGPPPPLPGDQRSESSRVSEDEPVRSADAR